MVPVDPKTLLATWPERERQWIRELRRVHIGEESVSDQVERYRKVSLLLMAVAGGIGLMLIALFTAFRSPGTGLVAAGLILGPIILSAWVGQQRLESRAARYLHEKAEVERLRASS